MEGPYLLTPETLEDLKNRLAVNTCRLFYDVLGCGRSSYVLCKFTMSQLADWTQ